MADDPPNAYAVIADYSKTVISLALAGLGAVGVLATSLLETPARQPTALGLTGLAALLLLLSIVFGIVLTGKLTRFLKDPTAGGIPADALEMQKGIPRLANVAYWLLVLAGISLAGTFVARALRPPESVGAEKALSKVMSLDRLVPCSSTIKKDMCLVQWDDRTAHWKTELAVACADEVASKPAKLRVVLDSQAERVLSIERLPDTAP